MEFLVKELIFKENNTLIQVSTSPSRSGRTCSYTFLTITIIQQDNKPKIKL